MTKAHKCYFDEMNFDEERNKWVCSVCGVPYVPPQRKLWYTPPVEQEYWKPWALPVSKLVFPRGAMFWRPWRSYSVKGAYGYS